MKAPLLKHSQNGPGCNASFLSVLSFLFSGSILLIFFNVRFHLPERTEAAVGAPPNWHPLLKTYFSVWSLVMKSHGDPYQLRESPAVDLKENCEADSDTMSCDDACEMLLEGEGHIPSKFCFKLPRKESGTLLACWVTAKMGCWNIRGNIPVFANDKPYMLQKHSTTDKWAKLHTMRIENGVFVKAVHWSKSPTMRIVHMTSVDQELIMFGIGSTNPIDSICDLVFENEKLNEIIAKIDPAKSILIGGHSEGSRWALCFNALIKAKGLKNERHVIGTGSVVASQEFMQQYVDNYFMENTMHLVLGIDFPPSPIFAGGILSDVFSISKIGEGVTFPQFGYTCDAKVINCLIPRAKTSPFDLDDSVQKVQNAEIPDAVEDLLHEEVHSFHRYRSCYWMCKQYFDSVQEFNFESNIPSLQLVKTDIEGKSDLHLVAYAPRFHAGSSDEGINSGLGELRIRHPVRDVPAEDKFTELSPPAVDDIDSALHKFNSAAASSGIEPTNSGGDAGRTSPGFEFEDIRSYPWLDWQQR